MQKFMVLYMAPARVIAKWMQKPESERKEADTKMRADWDAWMKEHSSLIKETSAAGKTKRVSASGVTDVANDIMLYSIVEGESPEAVAEVFASHPHLGIPEATIEVMSVRSM